MGLFGFIGGVASAGIKTVLTPVAVAKDAISVVIGDEPTATEKLIESIGESLEDAGDEIC
jgi:hypothetical protein